MIGKNNIHSFRTTSSLYNGSNKIGTLIQEYQVMRYNDIQRKDFNDIKPSSQQQFILHCTQKINIFNPSGINLKPDTEQSYQNYPVLLSSDLSIEEADGLISDLLDYSPKTVNTMVQSSGSSGKSTGEDVSKSQSNTVGSSTSQTNSYGTSVSVGAAGMGDFVSPSVNVTQTFEHSSTHTKDHSATHGSTNSTSQNNNTSSSDSMSMKDWGGYSYINPFKSATTWIFGQEYPWDAITCMKTSGSNPNDSNQVPIMLPKVMSDRLYDGVTLYPPSQLSNFGINFVTKALWLLAIDNSTSDEVTIDNVINFYTGSHQLNKTTVEVFRDSSPTVLNDTNGDNLSCKLSLGLMAMDGLGGKGKTAIVGFIPSKFVKAPVPATDSAGASPFEIYSSANNLLIKDTTAYPKSPGKGTGFDASEVALTATMSKACPALQMTAYFKVLDSINNYTLFIKHWKTGTTGFMLTIVINEDKANPIVKYVDEQEAEGGESNLMSIDLRNLDYASIDYHDYLQLGLNSIQITIAPIGGTPSSDSQYHVRALSIELN